MTRIRLFSILWPWILLKCSIIVLERLIWYMRLTRGTYVNSVSTTKNDQICLLICRHTFEKSQLTELYYPLVKQHADILHIFTFFSQKHMELTQIKLRSMKSYNSLTNALIMPLQFGTNQSFVSNYSTGNWLLFTSDNHQILMMKQFLCTILYCKYTVGKRPRWVKQPEKVYRPITHHRFIGWNTHFSLGWLPSSGQSFGNVLR